MLFVSKMMKGSKILKAFAFTVFHYTIYNNIPKLKNGDINFETIFHPSSGFYPFLSRLYFYQAMNRKTWKRMFESRYKSCGFKKVEQILSFLKSTLTVFENTALKMASGHVTQSLALINEFVLFLQYKDCELFLNKLSCFWSNYFDKGKAVGTDVNSLFCTDEKLKEHFNIVQCFLLTPYTFEEPIKIFKKYSDSAVDSALCSIELNFKVRLEESEIASTKSLINTGLGIRPHEELLLEFYGISTNIGKSPKICSMSSLDDGSSFVFSKENPKHFRTATKSHQEQTKEPRGSPGTPAVTSRLEQKRQKIRVFCAKRIQQKIEQMKLTSK